jgi:hypothetical protein
MLSSHLQGNRKFVVTGAGKWKSVEHFRSFSQFLEPGRLLPVCLRASFHALQERSRL